MATLAPDSGLLFSAPLFCLAGSIYPVDPTFDWSRDVDVLTDVLRDTHRAIRMHNLVGLTPTKSWFTCECVDREGHKKLLMRGLALMQERLVSLMPDAPEAPAIRERAPVVVGTFMRAVHVFVFAFLSMNVLDSVI